jgi:hypothetical protein
LDCIVFWQGFLHFFHEKVNTQAAVRLRINWAFMEHDKHSLM